MILGFELTWTYIMLGGIVTFVLLAFQVLVGMRKIKFKGRTHLKVHKWIAWALLAVAAGHGTLALVMSNGWEILS